MTRPRTPEEVRKRLLEGRAKLPDGRVPVTEGEAGAIALEASAPKRPKKSTGVPQVVEKPAPPAPPEKPARGKIPGKSGPAIGARLTPRLHAEIVELLETGVFLDTAAAAAGIDAETARRWIRRGARELEHRLEGGTPEPALDHLVEFARDVRAALVSAENRAVVNVTKWGGLDWRASAWYLERRAPGRWGLKVTQIVEGELDAFLSMLQERLPPDVFVQVLRAAAETDRGGEAPPDRSE